MNKTIKKIIDSIIEHPVWTVMIFCFTLCFIDGYKTGQFNIYGYLFLTLFILALISPYIRKLRKKRNDKQYADYLAKKIAEENQKFEIADKENTTTYNINEYTKAYEPKYLMTLNEKSQYRTIERWASDKGLVVFTKVRLLDLITPRKGQEKYKSLLWKIQAKHVDFVICDKDIRVKCIIEINDNSHLRTDRAERDEFVTEVLEACGYKVLQTHNATYEQLNEICSCNEQQ